MDQKTGAHLEEGERRYFSYPLPFSFPSMGGTVVSNCTLSPNAHGLIEPSELLGRRNSIDLFRFYTDLLQKANRRSRPMRSSLGRMWVRRVMSTE